jgi:nucleotide-binding universal stress UspA family protein
MAALKLLLATDGSADAVRAVRHVVALAERGMALEVVLLNVQSFVLSGEIGQIAPVEIAERKRTVAAEAAIAAGRAPLEAAGIPVTARQASGHPPEEIVAAAEALGCDAIVMGRRGLGALASMVMGSVSSQVVQLAKMPVTLV